MAGLTVGKGLILLPGKHAMWKIRRELEQLNVDSQYLHLASRLWCDESPVMLKWRSMCAVDRGGIAETVKHVYRIFDPNVITNIECSVGYGVSVRIRRIAVS